MIGSSNSRNHRTDARPIGHRTVIRQPVVVASHHIVSATGVSAVGVCERTDERHLVGDSRHLLEVPSQSDAGQVGLHFASDAAVLRRRRHFGIEGFDMRRSTAQPQPNDRLVFDTLARRCSLCPRPEHI